MSRSAASLLAIVCATTIALATPASAQDDRAIVIENAPITVLPDASRQPLRVAAVGTSLLILSEDGDWLQVRFKDPQFGDRTGFVRTQFVRINRSSMQPMDLSLGAPVADQRQSVPAEQAHIPSSASRAPLARKGFWFNAGLGYGTLGCDECFGERLSGGSGGMTFGGTINQRFLLGVGTTGYYRSVDGVPLTASTLDARMRFYPSRTSGFFLNAGLGLGTISIGSGRYADTEIGAGAMLGVGWDVRVGRNVSLTPFWNGSGISTSSVNVNFGQIGLGVTLH